MTRCNKSVIIVTWNSKKIENTWMIFKNNWSKRMLLTKSNQIKRKSIYNKSTRSVLNSSKPLSVNGSKIESKRMITIMRLWNKIKKRNRRSRVLEPNYFKPDFKLQKKMPKNTIRKRQKQSNKEIKKKLNFHHWILKVSRNQNMGKMTLHPHTQQGSILTLLKQIPHNMMISSMIYSLIKDTQPMPAVLNKKRRQILFQINSPIGIATLELKWREKSMRHTWNKMKKWELRLSKEGQQERN